MAPKVSHPQSADETADQLRREMASVRRELGADIKDVAARAQELTDWRSYVEKAPWAGLAVAAAVGFIVVPRKLNAETVDPATVAKLAKQNRIVVESKPKAAAAKAGFGSTMFRLISGVVLRAAVSFATQKAAQIMSPDKPNQPPNASQKSGATR